MDEVPDKLLRDLARVSITPPENELQLLRCLSHGMTVAMAAETVGKTDSATRLDLEYARIRLSAKNNTHAVAIAIRSELID